MIRLDGNFPMDKDDMIRLGKAYFDRYPDVSDDRNREQINLGYNVTRICIIEKILEDVHKKTKDSFRNIFYNIELIEKTIENLVRDSGYDKIIRDYECISRRIEKIKHMIESLPNSMIKERFVGGISHILTIIYLLKVQIEKYRETFFDLPPV